MKVKILKNYKNKLELKNNITDITKKGISPVFNKKLFFLSKMKYNFI